MDQLVTFGPLPLLIFGILIMYLFRDAGPTSLIAAHRTSQGGFKMIQGLPLQVFYV